MPRIVRERKHARGPAPQPVFTLFELMEAARCETYNDLGRIVGATRTTVQSVATRGLTPARADRWAVACGFHPANVWPEFFQLGAVA